MRNRLKSSVVIWLLTLLSAGSTAQAQAKYEPGLSRFAVPRSVIVTGYALIRQGPQPGSAEYTDCGHGFTAGVIGQTRHAYKIIFGDISDPKRGYIAKQDVRLLRRPFHLENKAFYAHDLTSRRITIQREAGQQYALVEMHLDGWDEIGQGGGSFQSRTPTGTISIRWQRGWADMSVDESGQHQVLEFASHPVYYLTVDAPPSLPVHLRTQEYGIDAVYVNGRWLPFTADSGASVVHSPYVPLRPHVRVWGKETGPGDKEDFALNLPGGHSQVVLRMDVFWTE